MTISNRREFLQAADAYVRAREPTTQLTMRLLTSFAEMLAMDCGGKVSVVLPGNIRIERDKCDLMQSKSASR